ncbi:hypothetical protein TNCV_2949361 [Trichonephila clavipes]|nr:hypothetical protein TNCV_2949361 [Trichonephila clavipes]
MIGKSSHRIPQTGMSERKLPSHCSATRWLLVTERVILNHGQVTWTTPDLESPLLTTTPLSPTWCGHGSRVVCVSDRGWSCHEFEPSTTKDPPCRAAMHVKSVES